MSSPFWRHPLVSVGPCFPDASGDQRAWVAKLARLLVAKPEDLDVFFRAGFGGCIVQVVTARKGGESGPELDAKQLAAIEVPGSDCGDP